MVCVRLHIIIIPDMQSADSCPGNRFSNTYHLDLDKPVIGGTLPSNIMTVVPVLYLVMVLEEMVDWYSSYR